MSTDVVEPVLHEDDDPRTWGLFAWCEGCDSRHYIPVIALELPDGQYQPNWEWDGNMVTPTFSPSILIYEYAGHHPRCHSFIREGVWDYLSDCTHKYAGTQRPLLAVDTWPEETWPND